VHLPTEDTRTRCLWLEQFQIAEYLSSGLGGRCLCQGRRCPRSARRRFPVIDIWPGPKPDGYRAIPCQFHAALCSASRHVCGAVPAACSHARVEVIAVALIHARIAARSGDGTAHTVSTGCGWSAPASLEAAISANCSLAYRIPVPDNRFPHTFSAAYHRYMSGSGPRYTTAPSPLSRASRHPLPASPSSGR